LKTREDDKKELTDYEIEAYSGRGGSDISEELFMLLCGPDPTSPAWASQGRHAVHTGERDLLIALLEDTVLWVSKQRRGMSEKDRDTIEDCKLWLAGMIKETAISFEFVCDVLGIQPESFLKRVAKHCDITPGRWKRKGPKKPGRQPRVGVGRPEKTEVPDGVQLRGQTLRGPDPRPLA
jgi:hypothetical protein